MIWFLLAVLFVGWHLLMLIGKVWGTDGVMVAVLLGLAVLTTLLFGGAASVLFSLGLRTMAWSLLVAMILLLAYFGWSIYAGLR